MDVPSWLCGDGRCACAIMTLDLGGDRGFKWYHGPLLRLGWGYAWHHDP